MGLSIAAMLWVPKAVEDYRTPAAPALDPSRESWRAPTFADADLNYALEPADVILPLLPLWEERAGERRANLPNPIPFFSNQDVSDFLLLPSTSTVHGKPPVSLDLHTEHEPATGL